MRSLAGAVLLLLIIFLAGGRSRISGGHAVDGTDSLMAGGRPAAGRHASPDSLKRGGLPAARAAPQTYLRHPLAYLSRAPVDSLTLLTGIGPVLAERIANARSGKGPFSSWEDVLSVKGIGPKKLAQLKAQAGVVE